MRTRTEPAGLVPAPAEQHTGALVRIGSGGRLTLSGAAPEAADWFAWAVGVLHGLRAEPVLEGADVLVSTEAEPAEFAPVAPVTGVDPRPEPGADERHRLTVSEGLVRLSSAGVEGAFRALTSLVQIISVDDEGGVWAPGGVITDGPRYAWRSLSLDVVRHYFTPDEVRRVIDLMALYKFNALHLHLTDSEGWRLESRAWPGLTRPRADGTREYYTREEFADLVAHAARCHITVIPEVDLPGHTRWAFDAYPELAGGIEYPHPRLRYLHPDSEAARRFAGDVIAEFAEAAPGPFLHLGGDEPFGMGHEDYAAFVRLTHQWVREQGKRVVGWQETARAGVLGGEDVLQYWIGAPDEFDPEAIKKSVPEEYHPLVDQAAETFRISPADVPAATEAGVPVLISSNSRLYLDRPYADACADPVQEGDRGRLGLPAYPPITVEDSFGWDPAETAEGLAPGTVVAGVEAAIWGETLTGFGDLAFLLLPRLPGVAEKAWTHPRTEWKDHRARLNGHPPLWNALGFENHFRPES
ncbi:family 20 glycosylhydrolase [Nocardiopsis ganjiahuensis]|uniref:family 20 glycosylhydrolase n=1 Tax=Nocardiopsis ganjiahuensis TaxID=239984 RepID=UPI00034BDFBF|nr:family 20 glycosylhydrolase [Nocardiopsis ganjiahuensis]